jgi:hypothetical protein
MAALTSQLAHAMNRKTKIKSGDSSDDDDSSSDSSSSDDSSSEESD